MARVHWGRAACLAMLTVWFCAPTSLPAAEGGARAVTPADIERGRALCAQGDESLRQGRTAEALDSYRKALAILPESPRAKAGVRQCEARLREAENAPSTSKDPEPSQPDPWAALAGGALPLLVVCALFLPRLRRRLRARAAWRKAERRTPAEPAIEAWNLAQELTCRGCGRQYRVGDDATLTVVERMVTVGEGDVGNPSPAWLWYRASALDQSGIAGFSVIGPRWQHPDVVASCPTHLASQAGGGADDLRMLVFDDPPDPEFFDSLLPRTQGERSYRFWRCEACKHVNPYPWCAAFPVSVTPVGVEFLFIENASQADKGRCRVGSARACGYDLRDRLLRRVPGDFAETLANRDLASDWVCLGHSLGSHLPAARAHLDKRHLPGRWRILSSDESQRDFTSYYIVAYV